MTKTTDNLKAAFAGESQANRKYLAFAKKADAEGFPQIAKLFRAAAEAETIHAHAHLRVLGGVKSTAENLNEAVNGETFEFTDMYPKFVETAKAEGNAAALISFDNANKVEQVHANLYKKAIESINNKQDLPKAEIFVCPICGDTFVGEAPDKCPICGVAKEKIQKIA
ncbi:MAG: rubrerythrin family protein [Nitrososphaerota archaeon]|jgi:rubrerythrin|uniref:rubrerythrin family protein n=1 Tax=Candidatus Bathycorpusculum sp. TaxID=2994959 RepID=UPI002837D4F3|nr:rubrerythrin family protein [Candidatus Termiticorpusculum sp.]MCL2257866.1 rubrerythrin family protein [Candidatus Termiticorpusculum sp.]MCL2292007.1 rubrerythrin family protein [Candidatus Termiticorpusculum sp.]MDR0461689.1 rubrerythrin family protein [Nitrososphaerota archaeon]